MNNVKINNQECTIDELIGGFSVHQKPSSNVDFFGDNGTDVFIQFKNGGSYIYKNVSSEHIKQMYDAESIGRFISVLSKNYTYVPVKKVLVKVVMPAEQAAK